MQKKNGGLNLALTLCVIFAIIFTACMIILFWEFQSTPDVLIASVFAALFGELGCCTLIYKIKYPNAFKKEKENEGDTEGNEEDLDDSDDPFNSY